MKKVNEDSKKKELLCDLQNFYTENGRPPRAREVDYWTFYQYFGSFNAALKIAGLELRKNPLPTKEEAILSVVKFWEKHGRAPMTTEAFRANDLYNFAVYCKVLGVKTWKEVLAAAGVKDSDSSILRRERKTRMKEYDPALEMEKEKYLQKLKEFHHKNGKFVCYSNINFLYGHLKKYRDHVIASGKFVIEECNTICAFTGEYINEGVCLKSFLPLTFTDYSSIRFNSFYCSVDVAISLVDFSIKTDHGFAGLRAFSFIATPEELRIIKNNEIIDILFNMPERFYLIVTESHKKHVAYKAIEGYNKDIFPINTDNGIVWFNRDFFLKYLPVIKELYPKFSKKEILGIQPASSLTISSFGNFKAQEYFDFILPVQGHPLFNFIVTYLNV